MSTLAYGLEVMHGWRHMPPPTARCPVCGSCLDESDELAYRLSGAARSDCLGCQHCADLDNLEQTHDLLRYTAWEADELWQ